MTQELIIYIVFSVIVSALIIDNVRVRTIKKRTASLYAQAVLDRMSALKVLEDTLEDKQDRDIEKTDGFLKFVSESREWAFQYIEEVQAGLESFKKKVDLDIKYILKYGQLIDHPLQDSINRIAEAYEELQDLLPTDKDQV